MIQKFQQFRLLKFYLLIKVLPTYKHLNEVRDINPDLLAQIKHFFLHYKDLEVGKKVLVKGWANKKQAEIEVERSCQRYLNNLDTQFR